MTNAHIDIEFDSDDQGEASHYQSALADVFHSALQALEATFVALIQREALNASLQHTPTLKITMTIDGS